MPTTTLDFLRIGDRIEIPPFPNRSLISGAYLSDTSSITSSMELNETNLNRFFPNPFAPDTLESIITSSPQISDIGAAWGTGPLSSTTPVKDFEVYFGPSSPSKVRAVLDGAASSLQIYQEQLALSSLPSGSTQNPEIAHPSSSSFASPGHHGSQSYATGASGVAQSSSPYSSDGESSSGTLTPSTPKLTPKNFPLTSLTTDYAVSPFGTVIKNE